MTVKTTGAEFKRFYNDNSWWTQDMWHEDEEMTVNGFPRDDDIDLLAIPDDAIITVSGGVVLGLPNDEQPTLETHFRRWKKKQDRVSIVIECDKDDVDAVKSAVRAAGGKTK